MLIDISAAGHTAAWSFAGARRLQDWLEERPWHLQGGFGVLRCADNLLDAELHGGIAAAARGAHGDLGLLDVRRVECGGGHGTPLAAILSAIEANPALSAFEARDALRFALADRPALFVLTESAPVAAQDWEDFVTLVEHYGKLAPPVRLCALVLDSRSVVSSQPSFDFTTGALTQSLLEVAMRSEDSIAWHAYLHHRSCWEAGGAPGYATTLGDHLTTAELGRDDQVERILGQTALSLAPSRFPLQEIADLISHGSSSEHDLTSRQRAHRRLSDLGATWLPPASPRLCVLPWLSRAILLTCTVPDQVVWSLRHNLTCTPLANELLAHCLRAEAQIRTQLHGKQSPDHLPESARLGMERLRSGEDEFIVYPPGYPTPPTRDEDLWAFAPLGDTLIACSRIAIPELFWHTLKLRNALSHGHYVTWQHLTLAKLQLERFNAFY